MTTDVKWTADLTFDGTDEARRNWELLQAHVAAEVNNDFEATMRTMHRDNPFQICYAGKMEIWGYEAVGNFYRERLKVFIGQCLFAHNIIVTKNRCVLNGCFKGSANGNFFGIPTTGKQMFFPFAAWVYFKDGLLLGESVYFDGAEVRRQAVEGYSLPADKTMPVY